MTAKLAPEKSQAIDPTEAREFEQLLLLRKQILLEDFRALEVGEAGSEGDLSSIPLHQADRGTDSSEHDLSFGRMESTSELMAEIDEALERIREGSYGICDTCGERIPLARLKAIPYARLCIPCKTREETR